MTDAMPIDQRIKELEALLKEQELRDRAAAKPFVRQSVLAALPVVLTVGLGFAANYTQSRRQHDEQLTVLARQGNLDRAKQEAVAREAQQARSDEANRLFVLQERDAKAQRERQSLEFAANATSAADRFTQEQLTLRRQHAAQQVQQAREFTQSLERQRRQSEIELILKASEVPTSLPPEQQDIQRARNLIWFADAGYIQLSAPFRAKLRDVGRVAAGQDVPLPVVQSSGGTAALGLLAKFEGFSPTVDASNLYVTQIGYGHDLTDEEKSTKRVIINGKAVDISNGINTEQAQELLRQDLAAIYVAIDAMVTVPLKPSQRDALAVFARNVGVGTLRRSTLLKRLNSGDYEAVPGEMERWTKNNGQVIPGLVKRRQAEIELWRMGS